MISISHLEKAISGKTVLIDTNIVIYLTDVIAPFDELSRRLFEMIEIGEVTGFISVISVGEVMQGPLKRGFIQSALEVKDYLLNFPNLSCEDATKEVIDFTGKDKRINWEKLRTVDSLIIASALKSDVNIIISNDKHFKQALPKEMLFSFDG